MNGTLSVVLVLLERTLLWDIYIQALMDIRAEVIGGDAINGRPVAEGFSSPPRHEGWGYVEGLS